MNEAWQAAPSQAPASSIRLEVKCCFAQDLVVLWGMDVPRISQWGAGGMTQWEWLSSTYRALVSSSAKGIMSLSEASSIMALLTSVRANGDSRFLWNVQCLPGKAYCLWFYHPFLYSSTWITLEIRLGQTIWPRLYAQESHGYYDLSVMLH